MRKFLRWRKVCLYLDCVDIELAEMEGEKNAMVIEKESVIAEYYNLKEKIEEYEQDMKDVMNHPNYCLPFIQPGRLIRIKHDKKPFDWGVVINYNKRLKAFVYLSFIV
jgi:ATP-dependent RNA helicase DOB1